MKSFRSASMRPPSEQPPTRGFSSSEALPDEVLDRDHVSVRFAEEDARGQKNKEDDNLDLENVGDVAREEIHHENSGLKSSLETDALS
jgi:hypothetical protein